MSAPLGAAELLDARDLARRLVHAKRWRGLGAFEHTGERGAFARPSSVASALARAARAAPPDPIPLEGRGGGDR